MSRRNVLWLVVGLVLIGPGCGIHFAPLFGPAARTGMPGNAIANPLFFAVADREFLWNQVVDEVDDYFRIEREQRMQESGGVLTEGRIDTHPTPASTALEPWRRDSTPGFERLQSTLQSIRRRATVRVIPTSGGYLVDVQVIKELEDVSQPERSTASVNAERYDGTPSRVDGVNPKNPNVTLGWITLGRDLSLEQQILAELQARLEDVSLPQR